MGRRDIRAAATSRVIAAATLLVTYRSAILHRAGLSERRIDAIAIHPTLSSVTGSKEPKKMDETRNTSMLIVEDDAVLRNRLSTAMEKRGFTVRTASGVADALAALDQEVPGNAVIDLRLIDGSGLDVVRSLDERNPEARAIILTGYGDIPTAVAAMRSGALDYIAKPATADEIVDVLTAPKDEGPQPPDNPLSPDEARWEHIEHVFQEAGGNVSMAARLLSMHRRTLQRILNRHGVSADATQ